MCFNDTAEQIMSGGLDNDIKVRRSCKKMMLSGLAE